MGIGTENRTELSSRPTRPSVRPGTDLILRLLCVRYIINKRITVLYLDRVLIILIVICHREFVFSFSFNSTLKWLKLPGVDAEI